MCIKAVFFDMDGTLVYVPVSTTEFVSNIYRRLGLNFSLEQIVAARALVGESWEKRYADYTLRTREAFLEYNYRLLEALEARGDLRTLAEKVQSHWENFPEEARERLYPEVKSVLDWLERGGIILGVLSNRLVDFSLKSLHKHGIAGYFEHVIGPKIAGAPKGKESPEMWEFALNKVEARPDEVMHIDNDYEKGIVPSKKAGIRAVLLDRLGTYTHISDCDVIHGLTEIFDLLRRK